MTRDITVILICLGVVALYSLWVLKYPLARCLWCRGKKVRRVRGKVRKCRNCKGHGLARRPGATAVHRFFWLVFGDHILDKRKADAAEREFARKRRAS